VGKKRSDKFRLDSNFHVILGIFYTPQICDMGQTALLLRIFSLLKIRRLRLGLNPRTWVPKASTLTPRPPWPLRLSQKNSYTKIYEDSNLLGQHKMSLGKYQYFFEILVITSTVKLSNGTNQDGMESQTFIFSYTNLNLALKCAFHIITTICTFRVT
jgi:hypothetical protein